MSTTRWWLVESGKAFPKAVEVERETEQSVFIGGKRRAKSSSWENYFTNEADAVAFLRKRFTGIANEAQARLSRAIANLEALDEKYGGGTTP